jgi:hypothetical protein
MQYDGMCLNPCSGPSPLVSQGASRIRCSCLSSEALQQVLPRMIMATILFRHEHQTLGFTQPLTEMSTGNIKKNSVSGE